MAQSSELAGQPAAAEIRIAHVYGKTGPFEAYAKQSHVGLMMGLEYATGGTMEVNGEKIVVIEKDTQLKPDDKIRRVVMCSGKVYYDLYETREAEGIDDVYLMRVEQLYPFPARALIGRRITS